MDAATDPAAARLRTLGRLLHGCGKAKGPAFASVSTYMAPIACRSTQAWGHGIGLFEKMI